MSINKNDTFAEGYDDSYRDVLSALSELDDTADIDYVKENLRCGQTKKTRQNRTDLHPLQHAAKFLSCFFSKRCA